MMPRHRLDGLLEFHEALGLFLHRHLSLRHAFDTPLIIALGHILLHKDSGQPPMFDGAPTYPFSHYGRLFIIELPCLVNMTCRHRVAMGTRQKQSPRPP